MKNTGGESAGQRMLRQQISPPTRKNRGFFAKSALPARRGKVSHGLKNLMAELLFWAALVGFFAVCAWAVSEGFL